MPVASVAPAVSTLAAPQSAGAAATPATPPAVRIEDVHKSFKLPHQHYSTLKERALHPFASRTYDELHAVDGVSVDIGAGEFFGIVGRNGSGKSTLLKCLAGIYPTDRGEITISGRLSPFIELGVGFNPELTARENVIINAIMLGLTRKQARERFDEIIAFAELEEFLDLKLKNYSSGMSVRLGFAVAVQVDADILLVDEVLAVGDAAFQQKCFEQFQALKAAGRTIVFVTHDMSAVERFCDRAMLLERGKVVHIGEPHTVAREYNQLNFGRLKHVDVEGERHGDRSAEIVHAWFEDGNYKRQTAFAVGHFCHVCVEVLFHEEMTNPIFGWALRNDDGLTVFATSSQFDFRETGTFAAGETVVLRVGFPMRLAGNRYTLSPSVARAGSGQDVVDIREDLVSMLVHTTRSSGGVVDLEQVFDLRRQ
jgi:ABC-type polysaccharide/polyol phosphate transport system ATPase subunit